MMASLGETPIFAQITEKMRGSGLRHPTSNDQRVLCVDGKDIQQSFRVRFRKIRHDPNFDACVAQSSEDHHCI
ncbi:Uncharacterised protein [Burkholderia pseudomallei]|nr:Uncharacterised protein [Burkholderia pseudomallei]